MISLDRKIFDSTGGVAQRMIEYGKNEALEIIIPTRVYQKIALSDEVTVTGTGGNKAAQFFRLVLLGDRIIGKYHIKKITTQDPFFTGLAGWVLAIMSRAELEVQVHGDFYGSEYYKKGSAKERIQYHLGLFVIKRASRVRVVGERIKQSMRVMGVPEHTLTVAPLIMDGSIIKDHIPRNDAKKKYPGADAIFLFLGRLEPVKNVSWLIDVWAQVAVLKPGYRLLIVGDGSQKKMLMQKVADLVLERHVFFEAWTDDPIGYIKTVDCLLSPSRSEGYSSVIREAECAGTPIIMSAVGSAGYETKSGDTIRIISTDRKDAWIDAIANFVL